MTHLDISIFAPTAKNIPHYKKLKQAIRDKMGEIPIYGRDGGKMPKNIRGLEFAIVATNLF